MVKIKPIAYLLLLQSDRLRNSDLYFVDNKVNLELSGVTQKPTG